MNDVLLIIALVLLVIVLALQVMLLRRRAFAGPEALQLTIEALRRSQEQALADVRQEIARCADAVDAAARRVQDHVSTSLRDIVAAMEQRGGGASPPHPQNEPLMRAVEQGRASIEQALLRLQEDLRDTVERAAAAGGGNAAGQRLTPIHRSLSSPFRVDPPPGS